MTIPLIPLIIALICIVYLTWLITYRYLNNKAKSNVCPFNNACTVYHYDETSAAAKRVVHLLIKNLEDESKYKQSLRRFLEQEHSS